MLHDSCYFEKHLMKCPPDLLLLRRKLQFLTRLCGEIVRAGQILSAFFLLSFIFLVPGFVVLMLLACLPSTGMNGAYYREAVCTEDEQVDHMIL